ncbi:hypothetical protein [Xenorhabdus sp. KK7.4]|uniref:hypothetical protein n=1 Tax=Xenorhabdus sp. KK7.4 TaxID=1851572 RepID=UPI00187CE320
MFIKTVTGVNERSQQRGNLKDDRDINFRLLADGLQPEIYCLMKQKIIPHQKLIISVSL